MNVDCVWLQGDRGDCVNVDCDCSETEKIV